jgi:hypothetical protein
MKRILCSIGALCIAAVLTAPTHAQDAVTVADCPGPRSLPVSFQVDCSHVGDLATKALCRPFAENQACRVFLAYRQITGIHLEDSCPAFKYTIYDKDKWPCQGGEAGGYAGKCGAELMADYSILLKSQIGPYDVHEILHVYQSALGALPYAHILFGPGMTEARRLVGDNKGYVDALTQLKSSVARSQAAFEKGTVKPEGQCLAAELYTEDSLYLKDATNVEQFYLKLVRSWRADMADRQARFNRMYDLVSGGTAKPFLLSHGCPAF